MTKELDTHTALRLGEALFNFLARKNDESEMDEFTWEDTGVGVQSGFIEIDSDTLYNLSELLDESEVGTDD